MAETEDRPSPIPRPRPTGGRHRLREPLAEPGPSAAERVALAVHAAEFRAELAEPADVDPPIEPTVPTPPAAVGRAGHVAAALALATTVLVQVAQALVDTPGTPAGVAEDVWHAALTVAQVVLVVAAAYGMRPGHPT